MASSFCLQERVNSNIVDQVISSGNLDTSTLHSFKKYRVRALRSSGNITVEYRQKAYNGTYYGRYVPRTKDTCCAKMWSAARADLFEHSTIDIDMVNSSLSILKFILDEKGITSTYIDEYVADRESFFPDIGITQEQVDDYNERTKSDCTVKDLCKLAMIAVLYGGNVLNLKKQLGFKVTLKGKAKRLVDEIKMYTKIVVNLPEFEQLVNDVKAEKKSEGKDFNTKEFHEGSLLSIILFDLEAKFVLKAMEAFKAAGFEICAFVYDGFQVYSTDKEAVKEVLNSVNEDLPATITFINKPFKTKCTELKFKDTDIKQKHELADGLDTNVVWSDQEAVDLFLEKYGTTHFVHAVDGLKYVPLHDNVWVSGNPTCLLSDMNITLATGVGTDGEVKTRPYSTMSRGQANICKMLLEYTKAKRNMSWYQDMHAASKNKVYYKDKYFDLRTSEFKDLDITPVCRIDTTAPVDKYYEYSGYQLEHGCYHPEVQQVLDKIFICFEDQECIEYVLLSLARAIGGNIEDKVFYIWKGLRNSGKGTLQAALMRAFGNYVTTTMPPVAKRSSGDLAKDNGFMLSSRHHIARIAFANEAKNTVGGMDSNIVLDGNQIKEVVASGGDAVTVRALYKESCSIVPSVTSFFAFNKVPKCSPQDAMQQCKLIEFPKAFNAKSQEETNGIEKVADNSIKTWIRETTFLPAAFQWLVYQAWQDKAIFKVPQPESFKFEQDEVITSNLTDPLTIYRTYFKVEEGSTVSVEDVRLLFAPAQLSKSKLTRMLKKLGHSKSKGRSSDFKQIALTDEGVESLKKYRPDEAECQLGQV